MRIRHIAVRNFRGIKSLDWVVEADMVCLIGPGNSCKTTILTAIEFALYPRWNLTITDEDFHNVNTSNDIDIRVTIGDLPTELIKLDGFGEHLRGWDKTTGQIVDEPKNGSDLVMTIRLRVNEDLEPIWDVYRECDEECLTISYRDRARIGVALIGSYVDNELSWARGSALSRATADLDSIDQILANAGRAVRDSVAKADVPGLVEAANKLRHLAIESGAAVSGDLKPGLDLRRTGLQSSAISLFQDAVPLRQCGLSQRRFLALLLQRDLAKSGGILLADELEQGLEPFRIRCLVNLLRPTKSHAHQVFSTTHSPIALVEHHASEIHVVRVDRGDVTISAVSSDLQSVLRALPEAFFCDKMILCEGATEWGMARALASFWTSNCHPPLEYLSTAFVYAPSGGGSSMPRYAKHLTSLGYATALWCDSDKTLSPTPRELEKLGIEVVQWDGTMALEQRICADVPETCLNELVQLAKDLTTDQAVCDAVLSRLGRACKMFGSVSELLQDGVSMDNLRHAIGKAAVCKEWFKTTDNGEKLGELIIKYLPTMSKTDTGVKIKKLEDWIFGDSR